MQGDNLQKLFKALDDDLVVADPFGNTGAVNEPKLARNKKRYRRSSSFELESTSVAARIKGNESEAIR